MAYKGKFKTPRGMPTKRCINCSTLWGTERIKDMTKKELILLVQDHVYHGDCFKSDMILSISTNTSKIDRCPDCNLPHDRDGFLNQEAHVRC